MGFHGNTPTGDGVLRKHHLRQSCKNGEKIRELTIRWQKANQIVTMAKWNTCSKWYTEIQA